MRIAIDCDLHEVTWVADNGMSCQQKGQPLLAVSMLFSLLTAMPMQEQAVVLYEIASAVDYTDSKGAAHNKRRWTIFNVAMAQRLAMEITNGIHFRHAFCVAPSSVWTKGYSEKQRHKLYACTGATHDLRECQAMLAAHARDPLAWVSLPCYLKDL